LIAIQYEREWANFCTYFLEEANLSSRPVYDSNVARVSNRPAVEARGEHSELIRAEFSAKKDAAFPTR
jgi:crotonobetainyl-CoA:carnitine CoA-transferase CaiB-like acyl-CoA transferase